MDSPIRRGGLGLLDFALEPSPLPLDAVIVTARGRRSCLTELAGSAGAINALDISRTNPINISDAATALPGVSLGSDMPWGSRVQIRGLSRDHIVFLIDGNRVSTTTEIAAQFGTVAAADIEQARARLDHAGDQRQIRAQAVFVGAKDKTAA